MEKQRIILGILIVALIFSGMPTVVAHIDIIDIGYNNAAQWDDIEGLCGYLDYQNVADYNISGAILVFVDSKIVAGKILDMNIRYIAGFRCSPIKTLEFPISEEEGHHHIVAYILSMNNSVQSTYDYYAEGLEEGEIEPEEEVEDWLLCSCCED